MVVVVLIFLFGFYPQVVEMGFFLKVFNEVINVIEI
jgi:hypothetical protein